MQLSLSRVAFITRAIRNSALDLRYGWPLTLRRSDRFPFVRRSDWLNTDYRILDQVFTGRVRPGDVLVDVGCSRGRVLNYWLRYFGDHEIRGIELDATIADATARRLLHHRHCKVVCGDAATALPEGTLFYLNNPFGRETVNAVRDELARRPPTQPPIRILYYHPKHLDAFWQDDDWVVERMELRGPKLTPYNDLAVIERA